MLLNNMESVRYTPETLRRVARERYGVDLGAEEIDRMRDTFLAAHPEIAQAPAPIPLDPDLAVQLEIDAHDLGVSRGVRFRLAELAEEIAEACGLSVSPCGIHLFSVPVRCCARCSR